MSRYLVERVGSLLRSIWATSLASLAGSVHEAGYRVVGGLATRDDAETCTFFCAVVLGPLHEALCALGYTGDVVAVAFLSPQAPTGAAYRTREIRPLLLLELEVGLMR